MQALRHYLLAVQFFTRIPVTGRLAAWVGYSPAMLRASAAHFPGVGWLAAALSCAVFALLHQGLGAQQPLASLVAARAVHRGHGDDDGRLSRGWPGRRG